MNLNQMNLYNDEIYINKKNNNNKKYYRKRGVNKKNKKYPTKPKSNENDDKKHNKYMKYNMINYNGNIVDYKTDYVNWKEYIINDDNTDDIGILGALICEKDNKLKITFLDSNSKKYIIEDYEMMVSGIEPYVWIPPVEYIDPEVHYEIIWKHLDFEFYKYERPYSYKSKLEGGPSIQFYDIDVCKL